MDRENYVLDISFDSVGCFCPVEGDIQGDYSIVTGLNLLMDLPPGKVVPRNDRQLNHVSKPLRHQMKALIDRTRWPVLVTFSDEGQGHTGHVYKCSGWEKTSKAERRFFLNEDGQRASSYSNGKSGGRLLSFGGVTTIQRWEHWICERGQALAWMERCGWERVPIPGKLWRSGNQAFTYKRGCLNA